ncbi:MAG: Kdo hydroxylase family protein [Proteobacteria bacterium]|nr:Kdo hydroxylase family protein [Pseudomonadota bacterium]
MLYEIQTNDWHNVYSNEVQSAAVQAFESGKILLLPQLTFQLLEHEKIFFSTEFSHPRFKNISYNPSKDALRGTTCQAEHYDKLKKMLARYFLAANTLMNQLFPAYQHAIQAGRTSFRPIEIKGRVPKSFRKDDTRLHVDAFPMSPTQGKRIIRIFTNINPQGKARVWRVGEPFRDVARQFLPQVRKPWPGRSFWLKTLGLTKSYCTKYDYTMLQIHNQMKADLKYQKNALQTEICFVPNTSWIVSTDSVSHAAMAGQYAFEQTFYLPVSAMKVPQFSPLRILEALTGHVLV